MSPLRLSITLLAHFVLTSHAFTFYFTTTPTQCANTIVQWSGGQAPFTLLLVPVGHLDPETRTIIQKDIPSGNSTSFVLDFPAQSQFVAVLNDASGIGAGGTSAVITVASSSDSSCLSTSLSHPKFFLFLPNDIGQCDSIDISWGSEAESPVDILGLIPGGESFEIANVTDSSTHFKWTADVRSGTQVVFVAGDKDGLGTGGSSDVMDTSEGSGDSCINDSSPSSTTSPAAGGVSSTAQGQGGTQTDGSMAVITTDNMGSTVTVGGTVTIDSLGSTYTIVGSTGAITTTDNSGSTVTVAGPAGPITTTDNAGSTVTIGPTSPITTTDNSGSTVTIGGGGSTGMSVPGSSSSGSPGSGGGTVNGSSNDGSIRDGDNLGLILGIVFGLLALGLVLCGIVLYRRRRRNSLYHVLETGRNVTARPRPWVATLTRGAHLRGGAGSSVDTLPSMYQAEPFILPSEHEPYYMPSREPPPVRQQHPNLAPRAPSIQNLLDEVPLTRDTFGGALAGMHGPDRKDSVSPQGLPPTRASSGHTVPQRGLPPPSTSELPTRVTRDSEDFSPEPEEMSPNPFDDTVVEIPPTYASVRRASRSNDREAWQSTTARLVRSNASHI